MRSSAVRRMLAVLLLGGAGCTLQDPRPTDPEGPVWVRTVASGVEMRNPTDRPIYYAAFEREFATRVRFAPCAVAEQCPSVPPNSTRTIPLSEVNGYRSGATAVLVYYWHLAPKDVGHVVESMRSVLLPIRS